MLAEQILYQLFFLSPHSNGPQISRVEYFDTSFGNSSNACRGALALFDIYLIKEIGFKKESLENHAKLDNDLKCKSCFSSW